MKISSNNPSSAGGNFEIGSYDEDIKPGKLDFWKEKDSTNCIKKFTTIFRFLIQQWQVYILFNNISNYYCVHILFLRIHTETKPIPGILSNNKPQDNHSAMNYNWIMTITHIHVHITLRVSISTRMHLKPLICRSAAAAPKLLYHELYRPTRGALKVRKISRRRSLGFYGGCYFCIPLSESGVGGARARVFRYRVLTKVIGNVYGRINLRVVWVQSRVEFWVLNRKVLIIRDEGRSRFQTVSGSVFLFYSSWFKKKVICQNKWIRKKASDNF